MPTDPHAAPPDNTAAGWCEIRVHGLLDDRWSRWFDGLTLTRAADGTTVLTGHISDQAALHGVLRKLAGLGLPLIAVRMVDHDATTGGG